MLGLVYVGSFLWPPPPRRQGVSLCSAPCPCVLFVRSARLDNPHCSLFPFVFFLPVCSLVGLLVRYCCCRLLCVLKLFLCLARSGPPIISTFLRLLGNIVNALPEAIYPRIGSRTGLRTST